MPGERELMLQGTMELLVLKIVSLEPMHGWGITQRIEQMSQQVFQVNQGSLYPALERLTRGGWLRSEWRTTESNRRARFYELTADGRARLAREQESWQRSSGAVNAILAWSVAGSPA
jgi:PadR family transcriptional regulator, regulatory protein PadR